jgi:hypothetical protein
MKENLRLLAVVCVALVIKKRIHEKIKFGIMLREEMGKENIGLRLKLNSGCPRRNVKNFGRVFLMLNYTDITQNTYIQS